MSSQGRARLLLMLLALLTAVPLAITAGCTDDPQPDANPVENGRDLYVEHCQLCHGDAATGDGALDNVPVHSSEGHTWHHADGQLVDLILGRLSYRGRMMPAFGGVLSREDVKDVLAYIKTNWLPEQRALQAEVSEKWEAIQKGAP